VFPSSVGTPLGARNLQRHFKTVLERAGLPKTTRFHDLWHTCATLLLRQGVHAKYVQELLGHADISLTLNVYSHVLPELLGVGSWVFMRRSFTASVSSFTSSFVISGRGR
jgi:integrase